MVELVVDQHLLSAAGYASILMVVLQHLYKGNEDNSTHDFELQQSFSEGARVVVSTNTMATVSCEPGMRNTFV